MGKSQLTCLLLLCARLTTQELEIRAMGSNKLVNGVARLGSRTSILQMFSALCGEGHPCRCRSMINLNRVRRNSGDSESAEAAPVTLNLKASSRWLLRLWDRRIWCAIGVQDLSSVQGLVAVPYASQWHSCRSTPLNQSINQFYFPFLYKISSICPGPCKPISEFVRISAHHYPNAS